MAFAPNPTLLGQVVHMLNCALAPDNTLQRQAQQALQAYKGTPEFTLYLSHILAHGAGQNESVRSIAGLVLKRSLDGAAAEKDIVPNTQVFTAIQNDLLTALQLPALSRVASNAVATAIRSGGYTRWPALGPALRDMLASGRPELVLPALSTLNMLAEDVAATVEDNMVPVDAFMQAVLPSVVPHMTSPDVRTRELACTCMKTALYEASSDAWAGVAGPTFMAAATLTQDPSETVLAAVVSIFDSLAGEQPVLVWPHIQSVLAFCTAMLKHSSDAVAQAAAGFWESIPSNARSAEHKDAEAVANGEAVIPGAQACLLPFLPAAVSALLDRMVVSREELAEMPWVAGNDAHVPDKPEAVRPYIRQVRNGAAGPGSSGDDDDEDGGDQSNGHAEVKSWSVRRDAASALESMADNIPQAAFVPVALAELQKRLAPPEQGGPAGPDAWLVREASILALGAISSATDVHAHMPAIFPFLLNLTRDPQPMVRAVALWTMGRYSQWVLEHQLEGNDVGGVPPLQCVVQAACGCMADSSKKVQSAGLSCLATLAQEAGGELYECVDLMWDTCCRALPSYQLANRMMLYDLIGELADTGLFSEKLEDPHTGSALVVPMVNKWVEIKSSYDDVLLIPLLESLAKVLPYANLAAAQVAPHIAPQCVDMISHNLVMQAVAQDKQETNTYGTELMETALDVLDGLVNACGDALNDLFVSTKVVDQVVATARNSVPSVRQSAFGLLGDLVQHNWAILQPHTEAIVHSASMCISTVTGITRSAVNNAVWTLGAMLKAAGPTVLPFVMQHALPHMFAILRAPITNDLLRGNTACALGRVAMLNPAAVAGAPAPLGLVEFLPGWAFGCSENTDKNERPDAYMGLCMAVGANPGPAVIHLVHLGRSLAHYDFSVMPNPALQTMMAQLLAGFRANFPQQWAAAWAEWNAVTLKQLALLGATP